MTVFVELGGRARVTCSKCGAKYKKRVTVQGAAGRKSETGDWLVPAARERAKEKLQRAIAREEERDRKGKHLGLCPDCVAAWRKDTRDFILTLGKNPYRAMRRVVDESLPPETPEKPKLLLTWFMLFMLLVTLIGICGAVYVVVTGAGPR
jgi:hypothetical protein